ncbi:AAA domain-containing protein [Glycomyces sp. TRM65418]|uniref:DEAD/DEAH box helicase n=1 Tax=Glycomyces sp. TRM65418 TaxID=2867006 RepID=UPI001CE615E5|nr:AAA domain-containing protein [Glycomyces sp. TRM65418]MCC3763883.1 AAA domain-containing protein [Glycomyces sp. TRM65418]QZD53586.1 AAA family ATPase [Glycomyces sp. TRM65418]
MIVADPKPGDDPSLYVYTPEWKIRLYLIPNRNVYRIGYVGPLEPRDHQRLADTSLIVKPRAWRVVRTFADIPPASKSYIGEIVNAWKRLRAMLAAERGRRPLSEAQTAFLDRLDAMIDAAQRIKRRQLESTGATDYTAKRSTGEQRHGKRSAYVFELAGDHEFTEGTFVDVVGHDDMRGRITRIAGNTATVKFDRPIDWDALPAVGALKEAPNETVFRSEREAVELLRAREAHNPHLLDVFVDRKVRKIPETHAQPREPLNPEQRRAFEKAGTVEDLLLVHGPPGTGKTRTISEIARAAVLDFQQKVLVSSHSNRAVDNVLANLPADLEVLRVGYRESVTPEGEAYLLDTRVSELRERIRAATAEAIGPYGSLDTAEAWLRELTARIDHCDARIADLDGADSVLSRAAATAAAPYASRLTDLTAEVESVSAMHERHSKAEQRWRRWSAASRSHTGIPILGLIFALVFLVLTPLGDKAEQRCISARTALDALKAEHRRVTGERDQAIVADPEVRRTREQRRRAETEAQTAIADATSAAADLTKSLRGLVAVDPPGREDALADPRAATAVLKRGRDRLARDLPIYRRRKDLLTRWLGAVSSSADELRNEFIRYADVIAATCIGSASRPELAGVEFDLAIIDEAGQIGINDVLVPLTRARRGVLVGDAMQLPPFLDTEVAQWGAGVDDPAVRELLAKSALEVLSSDLPDSHQVALAEQRRMPEAIADFVSAQFYGSALRTVHRGFRRDPLMLTPMTFIDTSALPAKRRMESRGRAGERWSLPGCANRAEAELLARLAAHYDHLPGDGDWCLIVPYRAQLQLVKSLLRRRIASAETIELNVGTVDSFQGGERDVVLYGFTRSNRAGNVGFLAELRRLNVAFTRAKSQLVMVGDLPMLRAAADGGFRDLMADLDVHLKLRGDVRSYGEIETLLRDLD